MTRAFIKITDHQDRQLSPLFMRQARDGGAIMAQIWKDGITAKLIPDQVAIQIAAITGAQFVPPCSSAFLAYTEGLKRDKEEEPQARSGKGITVTELIKALSEHPPTAKVFLQERTPEGQLQLSDIETITPIESAIYGPGVLLETEE